MKFQDIPQFTRFPGYRYDCSWDELEHSLNRYEEHYGLDLDPDFQRAHVWTEEQQRKYIEYVLKNGHTGKELFFNCPYWNSNGHAGKITLVDGKQRLNAVMRFMRNELKIFANFDPKLEGYLLSEFDGYLPILIASFKIYINDLRTREEVLQWYIDLNDGGTPHTNEEIKKVRVLLSEEKMRVKTPGYKVVRKLNDNILKIDFFPAANESFETYAFSQAKEEFIDTVKYWLTGFDYNKKPYVYLLKVNDEQDNFGEIIYSKMQKAPEKPKRGRKKTQ